jgi:geranylgeranyl diphosphate synthase, type II
MLALRDYTVLIEKELERIDFPSSPSNLYDPLRYFLKIGGKRMRPILTLLGAEAFGVDKNKALNAALAIEVFHNFSLIHDDIMDDAPLRRGQETVHEKWNNNIAILSGDVLLVKAYQLIAKNDPQSLPDILDIFNRTAVEVCEGQQMDMDFESRDNVSIDEYIEMIRLKTSVLLGCALETGAIVAGASKNDAKLIYEFGQQIGIAFQIQDDILDLYADPEKFGKQVGGDVICNKKTLLLLKAFEIANKTQTAQLNALLTEQDLVLKVKAVRELFDELGIREICKGIMNEHYSKAKLAIYQISISEESKKPLLELAAYLMEREV